MITKKNLQEAFTKLGHPIKPLEMTEIMAEHDEARDGQLSFQEFKNVFLDLLDRDDGGDVGPTAPSIQVENV